VVKVFVAGKKSVRRGLHAVEHETLVVESFGGKIVVLEISRMEDDN
jgi:hypothetical protein